MSRHLVFTLMICAFMSAWGEFVDDGSGLTGASSSTNMAVAPNTVELKDDFRLARAGTGMGSLVYNARKGGFSVAQIAFYFDKTNPSWQLEVFADGKSLIALDGATVSDAPNPADDMATVVTNTSWAEWSVDNTAQATTWYFGTLDLDLLEGVQNCTMAIELQITGGDATDFGALQIGSVQLWEYDTPALCSDLVGEELDSLDSQATCPLSQTECPIFDASQGIVYLDDGSQLDALWESDGVVVQNGNSGQFNGDNVRYARTDPTRQSGVTYFFSQGGMVEARITVAYKIDPSLVQEAFLIVVPYHNKLCKPPETSTSMNKVEGQDLGNGWKMAEIKFRLVVRGLNCVYPRFLDVSWVAPPNADIQVLTVKLMSDPTGKIDLPETSSFDSPVASEKINMLWIYIGAAAGLLLIILLTLCVLWKIRRKRSALKQKQAQGEREKRDAELMKVKPSEDPRVVTHYHNHTAQDSAQDMHVRVHVASPNGFGKKESAARRVIDWGAINNASAVPDQHLDSSTADSQHLPEQEAAFADVGLSPSDDLDRTGGASIDLAVPRAPYAPRTMGGGQMSVPSKPDIFESWHGVDYASGPETDEDMGGPTDSRKSSFRDHHNPIHGSPSHGSRTQSPSFTSSNVGVTAQIGMRIKELETSMNDQARAKSKAILHPPLDVTYGKKIGVGGFGAVYEGQWSGKTVAVKVIKMPDIKTGDDKEKMAIMEYAISGLLVHPNIVSTYQADIRPIFIDNNANASGPHSAWTGLQDYLSNDLSETLNHRQIHEWEVRLVMEYCNRGNLKEAIRKGHLMYRGQPKAMHIALLALDIAKAMRQIHNYKIIHGDLKPHNVLLHSDPTDERGWIGKIADFGLSVKIARGAEHVSGIQHGTEGYVAPEVLQTRRMQKASDVYSFGILMWEMWHSKLYYEEYKGAQKRWGRVPALEFRPSFERGCPEAWASLAVNCWKSSQADRPDFARIIKMLEMIIMSFRQRMTPEGVLGPE